MQSLLLLIFLAPSAPTEPIRVDAVPGQPIVLSVGNDATRSVWKIVDDGLVQVPLDQLVKPDCMVQGAGLFTATEIGVYRVLCFYADRTGLGVKDFEVVVSAPVEKKAKAYGVKKKRTTVEREDVPGDRPPHLNTSFNPAPTVYSFEGAWR